MSTTTRYPCTCQTHRLGFTLIEVLIIVTVLGIVAAMAVPFLGQTASDQIKAAAQLLAADIAFAQVESLAHGDDLRVLVVDTANETYHIAATSDTATPITNTTTQQAYSVTYGSGRAQTLPDVTIDSINFDGDSELGFGIYGQTDQAFDATITLECNGYTCTVTVNATTGEATVGNIVAP